MDLPPELWAQIFDLAADEDVIFQYGLPTMMSESIWFKNAFGKWVLRRPEDIMNMVQKRSYTTKKAIMTTCKTWHGISRELLFRCLFFNEPQNLLSLCNILSSSSTEATTISSSLGWWTKRIHVCSYSRSTTMEGLDEALISIIEHCPNLEIFVVDIPMGNTFGPVADALATYALKSIRTVHWNVSCELLPKVIWALDSLPSIICAHINFQSKPNDDSESIPLGSASGLHISLPHLQQLSLRGLFGQFLEEAAGWSIPSLRCVSFNCDNHRTDQPDVAGFLADHGKELTFLDLNCIPTLEVPEILDLCPKLITFCFNADWRLQAAPSAEQPPSGSAALDALTSERRSVLVNQPHPNIMYIGLHGLMCAFGIGYAAEWVQPDRVLVIQHSNEMNVAALDKANFPALRCVRALSRAMLDELNEADGPSEERGGVLRYDRWWDMLTGAGIRLEDCTGALLGTLPTDEHDSDGGEGEDEEYEDEDEELEVEEELRVEEGDTDEDEDDYDEEIRVKEGDHTGEWEFDIPPPPPQEGNPQLSELRQLLAECRAMAATREPSIFAPMFAEVGDMSAAFTRMSTSQP